MPIEFWWWIEPLFITGFFTMLVFVPLGLVLDKVAKRKCVQILADALLIIAVAPWIIGGISTVIWFLANVMIAIWRR